MQQRLRAGFLQNLPFQTFPKLKRKISGFRNTVSERSWRQQLAHTTASEHGCSAFAQIGRLIAQ